MARVNTAKVLPFKLELEVRVRSCRCLQCSPSHSPEEAITLYCNAIPLPTQVSAMLQSALCSPAASPEEANTVDCSAICICNIIYYALTYAILHLTLHWRFVPSSAAAEEPPSPLARINIHYLELAASIPGLYHLVQPQRLFCQQFILQIYNLKLCLL